MQGNIPHAFLGLTRIQKLKDNAELAWASYFYFDLDRYVLKENDIKITT